jgi:hypothetical protein
LAAGVLQYSARPFMFVELLVMLTIIGTASLGSLHWSPARPAANARNSATVAAGPTAHTLLQITAHYL